MEYLQGTSDARFHSTVPGRDGTIMYRRSRVVARGFHDDTPSVTMPASLFAVFTIFRLKQFVALHTLILISIQLVQAWLPFSQQLEGLLKLDTIPDIVCFQGLQCM
jgi:hypothetical protein